MKKILASIFAAAFFSAGISAIEYGAVFSTSTTFDFDRNEYDSAALEQAESLSPYIKVPVDETSYFAAEILLQHKLTDVLGVDYDAENNFIFDLTLLKFNKIFKLENAGNFELSAGRMFTGDLTGIVFSQTNDGLMLRYVSQIIEAGIYAGYTGLQNIKNVKILSSGGEQFFLNDEKKFYDFTAPYIAASAFVSAPYLFAKQTLSFEFIGFFKAGGPNELPDDEDNRMYCTLTLAGPILPSLFYSASLTMQTNDFSQAALLAKAKMTYFAPFKDATVGISAVYASGDNGVLSPFVGFTKQKACLSAAEPNYSGILKTGLSFSILPVKKLLLSFGTDLVFDMMEDAGYYGFQAALGANWQVFSDFKASLGANTFIGKDSDDSRTEITFGLAIAF